MRKIERFQTHDQEIEEKLFKITSKPEITEMPKKPCPFCKTENGLNAKRCFICGKELNYPQVKKKEKQSIKEEKKRNAIPERKKTKESTKETKPRKIVQTRKKEKTTTKDAKQRKTIPKRKSEDSDKK